MKKTKICPKCESTVIAKCDDFRGDQLLSIKTGAMTVAPITRYVCCDCGYVEEWIKNHDDLEKIKKNTSKVNAKSILDL